MIHPDQIKPDMPVVCSEDGQFATVDHMEGTNYLKLKKDELNGRDEKTGEGMTRRIKVS